MAHVSHMTLELSDKTRVLQAALQLPTFTIEQLADLSGVKGTIVLATVTEAARQTLIEIFVSSALS